MIKALLVGAGTFENNDNNLLCCPYDIKEIQIKAKRRRYRLRKANQE